MITIIKSQIAVKVFEPQLLCKIDFSIFSEAKMTVNYLLIDLYLTLGRLLMVLGLLGVFFTNDL